MNTTEKLKAENAKLRESLEDQEGYDQMLRDRLRQQTELRVKAETENAKLRDLLRELYHCSRQVGCDKCGYRRSSNGTLCETLDELRELGIEADG